MEEWCMSSGGLAAEIGKRTPFESLEEEALLNLARTADRLQIHSARLFREHALTPSQYNILRILRGEGHPLPSLEVARRMIVGVPGITGLIDRLEILGMVTRRRCEEDRRVVFVQITDAAIKLLAKIDLPLKDLNHKLIGHLKREELRELVRLLEKARKLTEQEEE
jgi:DNA-binding MarR family transcriptional regulator